MNGQHKNNWGLTISVPNLRLHLLSTLLFLFYKLSVGKKFICKVEILNVKQRRSWWDGSLWAVSPGSTLFAKAYYYRLWQWKIINQFYEISTFNSDVAPNYNVWSTKVSSNSSIKHRSETLIITSIVMKQRTRSQNTRKPKTKRTTMRDRSISKAF